MKIRLSDHFDVARLLRFTAPSIVMIIFMSVYSIVDGLFVSNFVGILPFAALNLIWPFVQILGCVGFIFGTGGAALVSATLGAGNGEEANRIFSLLVWTTAILAATLAIPGFFFIDRVAEALGADEKMAPCCAIYGRILLVALPFSALQNLFQSFFVAAEKPRLGLAATVASGMTNIALDALFIVVFHWGLVGAAVATIIAQIAGGIAPLFYFARKNSSLLRLVKPARNPKAIVRSAGNGLSEFVSSASMSAVAMLYNYKLMELAGENGVAAYGAVMYVGFIFAAIFIGYSVGAAPVVGFHYGANDRKELRSLLKNSGAIILAFGGVMALVAFWAAEPLAALFARHNGELLAMTTTAFRYYACAAFFVGVGIFGSAWFTALNNGIVSAAISFLRTMVFQVAAALVLPVFFGINGVWASLAVAEISAAATTCVFLVANWKRYLSDENETNRPNAAFIGSTRP